MKHYIIERLSWDTSGKEKETWKQCNKRDVEELSFVVEDLKEVSPPPSVSHMLFTTYSMYSFINYNIQSRNTVNPVPVNR